MTALGLLLPRDCPVCRAPASSAADFLRKSLDETKLSAASFSSRKTPEFMSYHLVRCTRCATVFASEAPGAGALAEAYVEADFSTAAEADFAAATYRKALAPYLEALPSRGIAIEAGSGTGAFLNHLSQLGFQECIGIEPSHAAIAAAPAQLKGQIRQGVFRGDEFPPGTVSLICCFQTMEHLPEPREFVEAAFRMLEPGGMMALITHDYTALLNRILRGRSPIIDIEHLQLFCPASLNHLVSRAGFVPRGIRPIANTYRLSYWLTLLPLPAGLKRAIAATATATHLADREIKLNVGNLLTVAQKPGS
jgi:SAM-dependent methyltransferase